MGDTIPGVPIPSMVIPPGLLGPFVTPPSPGAAPSPSSPIIPSSTNGGGMDPNTKALLVAQAPSLSENAGHDLTDISDATSYGSRQKLLRYGIGAAVGLAVGFFAFRKRSR